MDNSCISSWDWFFSLSVIAQIFFKLFGSVASDSLQPHELQHARPPCPSPTPVVHSDSHPSSQWCHPAILSSVIPFSSCPQSFQASESFPMSQLFKWGSQSTGVSALASFLPKNRISFHEILLFLILYRIWDLSGLFLMAEAYKIP